MDLLRTMVVVILCFAVIPFRVEAQTVRTWVASSGSDSNPCSRALPCRNFSAAVAAVSAGGEVVALDSAGYGPVSINKAVSIIVPAGIHAAIAPTAGAAVTVSGASVVLRSLYLNAQGGEVGIDFSGDLLHVEGLVINAFTTTGILFSGAGHLSVKDTHIRNGGDDGIFIVGSGGIAHGLVDHCRLERNVENGVFVGNNSRVVIRNTVSAYNVNAGIRTLPSNGATDLTVENCLVAYNEGGGVLGAGSVSAPVNLSVSNSTTVGNTGSGIGVGSSTTARISHNIVARNQVGVTQGLGSVVESVGNNTVRGNTTEISGSITPVSPN